VRLGVAWRFKRDDLESGTESAELFQTNKSPRQESPRGILGALSPGRNPSAFPCALSHSPLV
jgi:hypothetical protein